MSKRKYCAVWSWHNANSKTADGILESSFHLICIFSKCESHYVRWKTLLNTAHILTFPATNWICPQSLALITNIPPRSTRVHMPSIVWVPTVLSVSGRDSISVSLLCGALWLFETFRACGRQNTCTTDNSNGSYRFCWSLKWRWMWAHYPRLCGFSTQPLWWKTALRWVDQSF